MDGILLCRESGGDGGVDVILMGGVVEWEMGMVIGVFCLVAAAVVVVGVGAILGVWSVG